MKKPNRISMSLFDDELKKLINASAKIFPITQLDVDNNHNPSNYEYGRIENSIYRWSNNRWEYIVADDVDINWLEIKDKPILYPPSFHQHDESDITNLDKYSKSEADSRFASKAELHTHDNKSILDTIIQTVIDKWNSAYNHISDLVKHITSEERTLWNTIINKVDKSYLDDALVGKSDAIHNHDGIYYKKGEVDSKLITKEDKLSNRNILDKITETLLHDNYDISLLPDLDDRLYLIENGYSEGHTHINLESIEKITYSGINPIVDLIGIENVSNTLLTKSDINHQHSVIDIIDMPDTSIPSPHQHNESDIIGLDKYTKLEVDNLLSSKTSKSYVDSELIKKANLTTLEGHTSNTSIHVTSSEKNIWNNKQDLIGYVPINKAGDVFEGKVFLPSSVVGNAPFNIPHGVTPSTLINGDIWTTTGGVLVRINGVTRTLAHTGQWSLISQAEIEAGTATTARLVSAQRIKQAIEKFTPRGSGIAIGTIKPTDGSMWYEEII